MRQFWMPVHIAGSAVSTYLAGCKENGVTVLDPADPPAWMVEAGARAAYYEQRKCGAETYSPGPYKTFEDVRDEFQDEWRDVARAVLSVIEVRDSTDAR